MMPAEIRESSCPCTLALVGQLGKLRGGWQPPAIGPINNRPQVNNLPHKSGE
jgi:hypothetical protein